MREPVFSVFDCFDCDPWPGNEKDEAIVGMEDQWLDMDDSEFMDLFSSSVFDQEHAVDKTAEVYGNYLPNTLSDDYECIRQDNFLSETMPDLMEIEGHLHLSIPEHAKSLRETQDSLHLPSWKLLKKFGGVLKAARAEDMNNLVDRTQMGRKKLSTQEILGVAAERFIISTHNKVDGISKFIHPYASSFPGLDVDEARDVELINLLLWAAENVASGSFDLASRDVTRCLWEASDSGSPIQRMAFYLADALQQRMCNESGSGIAVGKTKIHPEKAMKDLALGTNNTLLEFHKKMPFSQVMQCAGIQTIIEHVNSSGKIHVVDLQVRSGIQWAALMQGLVDCSVQSLKITAVITSDEQVAEETGKRLLSFAQTLNLPFTFRVVYLTDMKDFKEDLLNLEGDEAVVVYSYMMLGTMVSSYDCLDNVMRAIARMRPALMVMVEVEANHNSFSFADRFVEVLFFYSAFFDCLEACMEGSNEFRALLERIYLGQGMKNILAYEGKDRESRNVRINVWRAFLARFGMKEIELSKTARYQASLVLKQFAQGGSCTVDHNDKGLIVGWKGTPLHSLSAWKFSL